MSMDELADDMEEEKLLDKLQARPRLATAGEDQPAEPETETGSREGGPPSLSRDPTKPPLVTPPRDLSNVPTTLEQLMAMDSNERSANEVIGVLIAAHEKEAMSVLERTFLTREDIDTIGNAFNIAKFGIGGSNPALNRPIPEVSAWIITKLRALRSVEGKSTEKFVESWSRSQELRRLQELEEAKRRQQYMGT